MPISIVTHRPVSVQIEGSSIVGRLRIMVRYECFSCSLCANQTKLNANLSLYYVAGVSDHAVANECVIKVRQTFGTTFGFSVTNAFASQGDIDGRVPIYTAKGDTTNHRVLLFGWLIIMWLRLVF